MRNILVRRGVYPWTISPQPRKDLGSPTDNSVRSADTIELKRLYVGYICIKRVIEGHLGGHLRDTWWTFISDSCIFLFADFVLKMKLQTELQTELQAILIGLFFLFVCVSDCQRNSCLFSKPFSLSNFLIEILGDILRDIE